MIAHEICHALDNFGWPKNSDEIYKSRSYFFYPGRASFEPSAGVDGPRRLGHVITDAMRKVRKAGAFDDPGNTLLKELPK